jgi:prepilin-type processing-associated H-X9-DG protein
MTPLSAMICSTRRRVELFSPGQYAPPFRPTTNTVTMVARGDYAINGGEVFNSNGAGPADLATGDKANYGWLDMSNATGVSYLRSEIQSAHLIDGATNTYLVGEKYLNPDHYLDGIDLGDNESMYGGDDQDMLRWSSPNYPPHQDTPSANLNFMWGSAHPGSFNISMCDGSVRSISYSIDPETHRRLGNRKDGLPIDASKL